MSSNKDETRARLIVYWVLNDHLRCYDNHLDSLDYFGFFSFTYASIMPYWTYCQSVFILLNLSTIQELFIYFFVKVFRNPG